MHRAIFWDFDGTLVHSDSLWSRSVYRAIHAVMPSCPIPYTAISEHMKTGYLVPPRDPEALAKGIDYLMDNPDVRHKMGKDARKRVLATFTWENAAREMVKVYEEVIRAHH